MSDTISKQADIIDSRDIIERIEELEEERAGLADALEQADEELAEAAGDDIEAAQLARDEAAKARDKATQALAEWDASDAQRGR